MRDYGMMPIQLARLKTLPLWYIRKRHSADSGISAVE